MNTIFGAIVGSFYGTISGLFACPTPIGAIGGFLSGLGFGALLGYNNKCPTPRQYKRMLPKLGTDYNIVHEWKCNNGHYYSEPTIKYNNF